LGTFEIFQEMIIVQDHDY